MADRKIIDFTILEEANDDDLLLIASESVTYAIKVKTLKDAVEELAQQAKTAALEAQEQVSNALTVAEHVGEEADRANTAAQTANEAAENANTQAQAAKDAAVEALNQTQYSREVTAATLEAGTSATEATKVAEAATNEAQTQAAYAKEQGDRVEQLVSDGIDAHNHSTDSHPELLAVLQEAEAVVEDSRAVAEKALRITNALIYGIPATPTQKGTLTYTGEELTPVWDGYDPEYLDISGDTMATDAGTYSVTFKPKGRFIWADGSSDARSATWSIGIAESNLELGADEINLRFSRPTEKIAITRAGSGAITVTSSDTDIATAALSESEVTVSIVDGAAGTATITVSVAADRNHKASSKTIAVTAKYLPDKKPLNDTSWEDIREVSDAGKGSEYWSVGDRKAILIDGPVGKTTIKKTVYATILEFDHNASVEGKGISFGAFYTDLEGGKMIAFADSDYGGSAVNFANGEKRFNMNHWGPYCHLGWKASDVRYDILGSTNKAPEGYGYPKEYSVGRFIRGYDAPSTTAKSPVPKTLMAALPEDLRKVMKPIRKYSCDNPGANEDRDKITTSIDYLPLMSEYEIRGEISEAYDLEKDVQKQYAYFADNDIKEIYRHNASSSKAACWLRSLAAKQKTFCARASDGGCTTPSSKVPFAIFPVFMV